MSEAEEIAASLVAKHGPADAGSHADACRWIGKVWPDWRDWIGPQQRDNIADAVCKAAKSGGK